MWSVSLVNSVKIDDDGDVTDFENENVFETLFFFFFISTFSELSANKPSCSSVN